jgi:hypothetical protein
MITEVSYMAFAKAGSSLRCWTNVLARPSVCLNLNLLIAERGWTGSATHHINCLAEESLPVLQLRLCIWLSLMIDDLAVKSSSNRQCSANENYVGEGSARLVCN